MTPESVKCWFTAQELADLRLPGLPKTKRKINERAAEERWALLPDERGAPRARARGGRGGGLEYHYSLLPVAARTALVKRGYAQAEPKPANAEHAHAWATFDRLSATAKAEAKRRAGIIVQVDALCAVGLSRSAAVEAAAGAAKISASTLWGWLAAIDGIGPSDRLPFLAPNRQGGGREADCDPRVWQVFKSDYLRPEKPTLSSCYERARMLAEAEGLTIPTERTMRRKLEREVDGRLIQARRQGVDSLRSTVPATRRSVAHLRAMDAVNIDGHKFDVFVKMPGIEQPVRPILVGIQDVYSRKILAWRVGEVESALLTRLAFADCFKTWGIPRACYLDNGRAFASKWITGGTRNRFRFKVREDEPTGLLTSLGVAIHWTKPYRGQSKPIERAWRDLADAVSKHPALAGAYSGNRPDAKPENYGSRAVPLADFLAVLELGIRAHNSRCGRRTETAKGRSFDEVFSESYAASDVAKATEEQLRLALLTGEQVATNRKDGSIMLAGNRYWDPALSAVAGKRVVVRFDPDNLHQALAVYAASGEFLCMADVWEASGFDNAAAARARGKQEAELRKTYRRLEQMEQLLSADEIARQLPDYDEPEPTLQPAATRIVRHRGQTAAALKITAPVPDAAPEPAFIDRFARATERLRLVE